MSRRPVRAHAFLLLLALLGGGFGLPWYDVLAFHGPSAKAPKAGLTLDGAGAAPGHSQVCALSQATLPTAPPNARGTDLVASLTPTRQLLPAPKSVLFTQTDLTLGQPRAPPAPTA